MSGKCGENAGKMRKCQENNGKNMGKTIICNYGKKTTEMWNGKINIMCGKHQDKKDVEMVLRNIGTTGNVRTNIGLVKNMEKICCI